MLLGTRYLKFVGTSYNNYTPVDLGKKNLGGEFALKTIFEYLNCRLGVF
jgi:hypothetical protein